MLPLLVMEGAGFMPDRSGLRAYQGNSGCSFMERPTIFFALCCLGKIPGGAPFSQLHKSGNGSRVDRP